jgi:Protein of unknown function (DUF3667)
MRELIGEVAEEVFQFDSRILHTVVPFLVQPGKLTKEFVEGRRVRYSSPLRLFLFTSALYLVAAWLRPHHASFLEVHGNKNNNSITIFSSEHGDGGADEAEPLFVDVDGGIIPPHPDGGDTRFEAFQRQRLREWSKETKGEAGEKLSEFVIASIPKAMFVLMPLFALLLALFFRRPQRFYLEHFIFALHYHSFLFIVMTLDHVVPALYAPLAIMAVVYLVLSLRRVYAPTAFQLVWKTLVLVVLYTMILTAALGLLAVAAFEFA